jgi:chromosome segregation and condensation protein ScpB
VKFRQESYKAADRARIEELGAVVKQKIRDDSLTEQDIYDFQARYAAVGGRIESFGAAMQRWTKDATQSVVNTLANSQRTSYGRNMNLMLGSDPLEDMVTGPQQ